MRKPLKSLKLHSLVNTKENEDVKKNEKKIVVKANECIKFQSNHGSKRKIPINAFAIEN
jgi:hypothetical protein